MNICTLRHRIVPLLVLLWLGCCPVKAQFDAQFSHYWALRSFYNPACTGHAKKLNINGTYSSQLSGFTRNAKTMYFGADMPLVFVNEKHNVGLGFFNESIGLFTNQRFFAQYAFRTHLLGGQLGGGLQIGLLNESFDGSKVDLGEESGGSDPAFPTSEVTGSGLDIGLGLYYEHPWFYAGLSVAHLNAPTLILGETNEIKIDPTYYFIGGGNIRMKNPFLSIQPSVMLQTDGVVFRTDITGRLVYTNDGKSYYGGLGYCPGTSCTFLIGALFQGVNFGYSYELFTNEIGAGNGSHNLFVGYQMNLDFFKKGKNKHKSIRIL